MEIMEKNPFVRLDAYIKNANDTAPSAGKGKEKSGGVAREDNVILSPRAKAIQEAKQLLDAVPDVREERIAEIKKQIEAGTYQVDAGKVAAKMVEESLLNELL